MGTGSVLGGWNFLDAFCLDALGSCGNMINLGWILFIYLYQEGGQGHLWTKKWAAPILASVLCLVTLILNHHLNLISGIGALLFLAASNGFSYGKEWTDNKLWKKILFRGLCGASWGLCGFLIGLGTGHLWLGVLQLLLATGGSILFGVLNPFPSSLGNWATRSEDICISLCYIILIPFLI